MTNFIQCDGSGRLVAWTYDERYAEGFIEVDLPDSFTHDRLNDWVYNDGEWSFDPLPEPEPDPRPTLEERVTTIEDEMNALTSAFEVSE